MFFRHLPTGLLFVAAALHAPAAAAQEPGEAEYLEALLSELGDDGEREDAIVEEMAELALEEDEAEIEQGSPGGDGPAQMLAEYLEAAPYFSDAKYPRALAFERDLRAGLAQHGTDAGGRAATARELAPRYGLPPEMLERFMLAWIEAELVERWDNDEQSRARRDRLTPELIAIIEESGHAPLTVEIGTHVLLGMNGIDKGIEEMILANAPDPADTAWRMASYYSEPSLTVRFLEIAPEKAYPALWRLSKVSTLDSALDLPIAAWLASEEALQRVGEGRRDEVRAFARYDYVSALLEAGQWRKALDLIDELPGGVSALLQLPDSTFVMEADEIAVVVSAAPNLEGLSPSGRESYLLTSQNRLREPLAAAYILAGRKEEAAATIALHPALGVTRDAFSCIRGGGMGEEGCPGMNYGEGLMAEPGLALIDRLLIAPDEDPYLVAEMTFAFDFNGVRVGSNATIAQLRCQAWDDPGTVAACAEARQFSANRLARIGWSIRDDMPAISRAVDAAHAPGLADLRALWGTEVERQIAELGGIRDGLNGDRPSIDPLIPPFIESALPERIAPASIDDDAFETAEEWPEGKWPDMPPGHWAVRWETADDGRRAVISLSSRFDPTGEVSMGGYWLHLARPGEATWETLYLGLSEYWPYVVPPQSGLPMLDGETLRLEVAVREIDTAKITYPPIGVPFRRQADGRLLTIPLAMLRADSDGDGFSDLAEAHLLLDREGAGRPFVLGEDTASDCPAVPDRLLRARAAAIGSVFRLDGLAIVTSGTPATDPLELGGMRRKSVGDDWPIYLSGDPDNFRCLSSVRPIFVYTPEQVAELQRRTPDFSTVEMPELVMNRDATRGYVVWSAGWTGGTFRLMWIDGAWQVETVSSWIT